MLISKHLTDEMNVEKAIGDFEIMSEKGLPADCRGLIQELSGSVYSEMQKQEK